MKIRNITLLSLSVLLNALITGCDKNNTTPDNNDDHKENVISVVSGSPADSRWELPTQVTSNPQFSWKKTRKCYSTFGEGRGAAFFTAKSESGSSLSFTIAGNGPAVKGLSENDFFLFCVPMESLAAGTDVDFMITMDATSTAAPRDWVFEHFEDGEWLSEGEQFVVKHLSSENHTSIVRSFRTTKDIMNDTLKMRCRVSSDFNGEGIEMKGDGNEGCVYLPPKDYQTCRILTYPEKKFPQARDTRKVMALGNSFSYYQAPVWMLKEIARSEGHQIDLRMNVKGSQTFANHLKLDLSENVINEGGYQTALLQDQSTQHSNYFKSPSTNSSVLNNTIELKRLILEKSPDCEVILENTWAYAASNYAGFGNYTDFDSALQNGGKAIAGASGCQLSPIGAAFAKAREKGLQLYYTDDKHQGEYGAYLKACVNYLMIYKTRFDTSVSDCNLPARAAASLRETAEETVNEYINITNQ